MKTRTDFYVVGLQGGPAFVGIDKNTNKAADEEEILLETLFKGR